MKSWREKLESPKPHEVKPAPMSFAGMKKGQTMLIPSALQIDEFIRRIPKGTSMDVKTMRAQLAEEHSAEVSCPITTGILLRIVAETAWEDHERGTPINDLTPVWRVLDETATTTKKLSYDPQFLLDQREREGLDG